MEKMALRLQGYGLEQVHIAMHIYKHPMEPEIGNERLALAELLKRKIPGIVAGPDLWTPTKQRHPDVFASDGVHPNALGAEIMAQKWFETLLEYDGLDIPEWSREEMANAINNPVEYAEEHYNSENRSNLGKPERKDHLSPGP